MEKYRLEETRSKSIFWLYESGCPTYQCLVRNKKSPYDLIAINHQTGTQERVGTFPRLETALRNAHQNVVDFFTSSGHPLYHLDDRTRFAVKRQVPEEITGEAIYPRDVVDPSHNRVYKESDELPDDI